jgi:hypothetical protein
MATSSTFYSAGGFEAKRTRTFTDTNTTILGDFTLATGGDATLPTGVLTIGGSLSNSANFDARTGTVRFNSTSGTKIINPGVSDFSTIEINSTGGDITISENATATVAVNLTNANNFTLASGRSLTTLGTFTNAIPNANTTWTGSTLIFAGNNNITTSAKSYAGDTYATLRTLGTTTARFWHSSASVYDTQASSSIYSQDHAGVDGDLNIYGTYRRSTGTEHWSQAIDFDGATLSTSSLRQANVRIASSSSVGFTGGTLRMVGSPTASTTISALSGAFSISATNTTIVAEHFHFSGTGLNGLRLNASTTLSTFRDGFFTVLPGQTGITISSTTVAHNPSAQFFRIGFATTTAGSASNVTLTGTTSAFVWFREGSGNLYGEAFDAGDANPGSIRWDDSSNSIVVSGVVYADDGITPLGAPTCDGITNNVRIVVNSGSYASSTTCNPSTGAYSFPAVEYIGDPTMIVYLDTNGGAQGSVVTKTPTANITDMHVYANRVITRHQDVLPLTIADMVRFTNSDDSDISFIAATGTPDTLLLLPNTELYVFASTTFAPAGNITLSGNGNSNSYEGTLQIGPAATFTASSTQTHTLAGRFVMATTSTFNAASSTFIFNATTTGKSITAPNTVTFNELVFAGTGGGWNITAPLSVVGSMQVASGTVTGTSNITIQNGSLSGNGVLSLGAGTVTINRTNTLGGTTPWTFNNLTLGSGSVVGTTTLASTATTTILGALTIANAHTLSAGSGVIDLAGSGTVFVRNGTFAPGTGTIRYSGNNATILGTTYYNAVLSTLAGSSTFTGTATGINILNNLIVGGNASTTVTFLANDPVLTVGNNLTILNAGTLVASDIATTTIAGSYTNTGIFVASGGRVIFTGSGTHTIAAGNSSFAQVTINGSGNFTVTQNATSTSAFTLLNHANFTVDSGRTLALGGAFTNTLGGGATTFTGSTLSFYGGGDRIINASTTSDTYETLMVAAGTNVRMWNSEATTYSGDGGIYSQDHAGINGRLHIYGNFTSASATDHWSYATDFDGTVLTGGNERLADVRLAAGATVSYSGGSLSVIGSSTATTTIGNQGSGTYSLTLAGGTINWNRVQVRDIGTNGVVMAGAPIVTNFSNTDHLVTTDGASALTVGGTVINANEAKSFTGNIFATSTGVTSAFNVTATGTTVSSWRFTNHTGNLAGEAYDSDPGGDPGYITWDDSAALITISGVVYSDEGSTLSTICDGVTNNIRLVVANEITDTTYNTSCDATTRVYSISNVAYSPLDTLVVYIVGETEKATTVTTEPISNISNLHLYENRVIVRHESTNPLSIARMSVWSSGDDSDVQYTAIDSNPDTLTIPANRKLLIWTGKTFSPDGTVTVVGGGAGDSWDGTLEAQANARLIASSTVAHAISVGGSFIFGAGAEFTAGLSTTTFTTTGSARTIDVNQNTFHNIAFTGSGSWTIADATLTTRNNYLQTAGAVTFGTGTTTIGRSFNTTGGSFTINNSPLVFTSTSTGNTVRFNNSPVADLFFTGTSSTFTMTDTNATTTGSVIIERGSVTFPSGNFAIGGSLRNQGGTITHNTSDLIMTASTAATVRASSSDLFAIRFVGAGPYTIEDVSATFRDDFIIASGTVTVGTGTLAIGGSFDATGGTFNHASGTVLFNATTGGKTVNPGSNVFHNVVVGSGSGGWTFSSATTTNNFSLTGANNFTLSSGQTLAVGGVFSNLVASTTTTWTGSTLRLYSGAEYSINTKVAGGDSYATLRLDNNTRVRAWHSSFATTTLTASSSVYSQNHANVNGALRIIGSFVLSTTTEFWNYANDFDGTTLVGGDRRSVAVTFDDVVGSGLTMESGTLQIIGASGATTTVSAVGAGTYPFVINSGTLNASFYSFSRLGSSGLVLNGNTVISSLDNGSFTQAANSSSMITLATAVLNTNSGLVINNVNFSNGGFSGGVNVNLAATSTSGWTFTNHTGNLSGEAYDIDGTDQCGSIRWDDSDCLLIAQTNYRWRNDDGGIGALDSEWFDTNWGLRKRIAVTNPVNETYSSTSVKVVIEYESQMQANFSDIRFTDSDGITPVPYWLERVTASTEAIAWVLVPVLPANGQTVLHMYYDNSAATTTTSSGTATFAAFDDFEDNNITEYSGDTSLFQTDTAPVFGGMYALEAANKSGRTTNGLYRTNQTVSQGQIIRWMQYVSTDNDDACTLFGFQSVSNNYALCLQRFGIDRMLFAKNIKDNDSSGTVLSSTTVTFTTGWYEVEVDWRTDNTMRATLYNSAGAVVASTTATDSSYTSGGYGFSFWINNGSWDSFTARSRVASAPAVAVGAPQGRGGATWRAALNTAGGSIIDEVLRLRVAVENTGLAVTNHQYRLEFANKGIAPSCGAVPSGDFITVPNQASCGSSPVCMATSTHIAHGDLTSDLLFGTKGTFTAGLVVTSPNSQSGSRDIGQRFFTELEYVLKATANADDDYCFRVTNNGTLLDFYQNLPELSLQFDPVFGAVSLNAGQPIILNPGTTTTIYATGTVTDFNGFADLVAASSTLYRSGVGPACVPNNNNCYQANTSAGTCAFTDCSGNTCVLSCAFDIFFHADPTDTLPYEGEEWIAYLEARDTAGVSAIGDPPSGVELLTMRALTVENSINYGSLFVGADTGTDNASTTIVNVGNIQFVLEVEGSDLSDGNLSTIPAEQQKFATSTFNYSSCTVCAQLSTSSSLFSLLLPKPSAPTPPIAEPIYWGIAVPFGTNSAPHSGTNIFTPVTP